jgi:hypothetical protein
MLNQQTSGQMIQAYTMPAQQKQVHDVFLQFLPTRVERVNRGNLKEWLQQSPQKARVLLVTAKTVTPPMFTKLSLDHGAGVMFGELRQSDPGAVEELKKLGGPKVDKFPKLLMGKALGEGWAAPTDVYGGKLSLQAIGESVAKINPGQYIPELTSPEVMEEACTSKGGICVVAVLPSKFDKHLDAFKKVAGRWLGDSVPVANFVWLNEEKQEKFVDAFRVENFPGLVALNARKKLYSTLVGTFDEENVYLFVLKVLQGKQSLSKLDSMPSLEKVSKTMPAGDLDALLGKKMEL